MRKRRLTFDPISRMFRIRGRFLRSINIQRDFDDPSALDGYVPTELATETARRIILGLKSNSGQRAWRLTGDYGSGKSSFALYLAHALGGREADLPPQLRRIIHLEKEGIPRQTFLPIFITAQRERAA